MNNFKYLVYLILPLTSLMLYACSTNSEKQGKATIQNQVQAQEDKVNSVKENSSFTIETASVNSNFKLRDSRIYTYFFSKIGAETITGELLEVTDSGGKINIVIGDNNHSASFTYVVSSASISLHTSLNLDLWKASLGIVALNEICKDVHTGTDGISKLWPDVDVGLEIDLEPLTIEE